MASDTHPEGAHHEPRHLKTPLPDHSAATINTLEAPEQEYSILQGGYLVTSPLMSEATLPGEQVQNTSPSAAGKAESMDSIEYTNNQYSNEHRSNGHPTRTNSGSSISFRNPLQSSAATVSSQYQLTVATFHKRNQDTNSFRTGQQFLIKLDLKNVNSEPFKNPMSLILPRKMIQGHQKSRQSDSAAAAAAANTATDPSSTTSSNQDGTGQNQPQDMPTTLSGDPENHFYLEVTVHLTSSEALVRACPECCHKVEGKVRKPSTGPGAPKVHGAGDGVDPGQILQFCVSDHVVDFTHGTSTVMAKVLCSSTHHDKRGNNDRYFFKLSLMQYINGQKIRVGSCRTKDILFTGNHKNKSMASSSFSEDKAEVKSRVARIDDDAPTSGTSILMDQYSEEPDSISEEPERFGPSQPHASGRSHHAPQHISYSSYGSSRYSEHIPRIHEPSVMDPDERRQHMDKDPYAQGNRSPVVSGTYMGSGHNQSSSDARLSHHSGYPPAKSKSWNDSPITPKITKIIPDVGDMLGGTELTIFGSGFHDRLVPYFDSLPATDVYFRHSDVMTCRIPPRLDPKVVNVSFQSSVSSGFSSARPTSDVQFSYADKTGLLLAELAAEVLAMGRDAYDDDEPHPQPRRSGSGIGFAGSESGDRTEQRVGGLGDLRSKATKVIRRGSMRRDSSEINSQRSGMGGSRLNPMSDSPRPHNHSPLPHEPMADDDEEFEHVVAEMMTWSIKHSVAPSAQTSNALESAIVSALKNAGDLLHISLPNSQGHTMLHFAVVLDMNQLAAYLLNERIEINAEDWNGFTALHYAAWLGRTTMYDTLRRHGASEEVYNRHEALPPHLADSPNAPAKFLAMYHSKVLHDSNLKEGIHATYSRAKRAGNSSGHMYVKAMSLDAVSSLHGSSSLHRDSGLGHDSRHMVSSPPPHHSQVQPHSRPRPGSMHAISQPSHGAQTRSPSPLRESYPSPYPPPSAMGSGRSTSPGARRFLRPTDAHPTRAGSLPSIRLEPDRREGPHAQGSSYHSYHHHVTASPSSSPRVSANGPPASSMHHPRGGSHGRYPSSPTPYDHAQRSPQHYEHGPEERRSDRMLPSFGVNLPVPYSYPEDSNRSHSPIPQGGPGMEAADGGRQGAPVGAGQKRPSPYHGSTHDGPSNKSVRMYDSPSRPKSEYDMQPSGSLPMDKNRPTGTNIGNAGDEKEGGGSGISNNGSNGSGNKDGGGPVDENGKPTRKTGQASHTCPHPNCNKSFTRPFNLRAHMRVHTAERPYKCDTCALAFSRLHDRNRHAKLHTGIKPFQCQFCHHPFIRPDALRRHMSRGGGQGCGQKAVAFVAANEAQKRAAANNSTTTATKDQDANTTTTTTNGNANANANTTSTNNGSSTNGGSDGSVNHQMTRSNTGPASRSSSGSSVRSTTSKSSASTAPTLATSAQSSADWSSSTRLADRAKSSSDGDRRMEDVEDQESRSTTSTSAAADSKPGMVSEYGKRVQSPSGMDEDEEPEGEGEEDEDHDQAMDESELQPEDDEIDEVEEDELEERPRTQNPNPAEMSMEEVVQSS